MVNDAVRRIMAEVREFSKLNQAPNRFFYAAPLESDLFEWHFTVRGPPDTAFADGVYHGRIVLPAEYPLKAPEIILLTPNGRFEVGKRICLSVTSHHQETWQPSWGVRTILTALVGFMPSKPDGVGALDFPDDDRRALARRSWAFRCDMCGARPIEHVAVPRAVAAGVPGAARPADGDPAAAPGAAAEDLGAASAKAAVAAAAQSGPLAVKAAAAEAKPAAAPAAEPGSSSSSSSAAAAAAAAPTAVAALAPAPAPAPATAGPGPSSASGSTAAAAAAGGADSGGEAASAGCTSTCCGSRAVPSGAGSGSGSAGSGSGSAGSSSSDAPKAPTPTAAPAAAPPAATGEAAAVRPVRPARPPSPTPPEPPARPARPAPVAAPAPAPAGRAGARGVAAGRTSAGERDDLLYVAYALVAMIAAVIVRRVVIGDAA